MRAPRNAADSIEPAPVADAIAASVDAARPATWRSVADSGEARTTEKSRPALTARAHRRKLAHPDAAVGPTIRCGLTRDRTAAGVCPLTAQAARASAIAPAE